MTLDEDLAVKRAAFLRLKKTIDTTFPPKQFVAIVGDRIVADDADIDVLREKVANLGIDPADSMVDRAGEDTVSELIFL